MDEGEDGERSGESGSVDVRRSGDVQAGAGGTANSGYHGPRGEDDAPPRTLSDTGAATAFGGLANSGTFHAKFVWISRYSPCSPRRRAAAGLAVIAVLGLLITLILHVLPGEGTGKLIISGFEVNRFEDVETVPWESGRGVLVPASGPARSPVVDVALNNTTKDTIVIGSIELRFHYAALFSWCEPTGGLMGREAVYAATVPDHDMNGPQEFVQRLTIPYKVEPGKAERLGITIGPRNDAGAQGLFNVEVVLRHDGPGGGTRLAGRASMVSPADAQRGVVHLKPGPGLGAGCVAGNRERLSALAALPGIESDGLTELLRQL